VTPAAAAISSVTRTLSIALESHTPLLPRTCWLTHNPGVVETSPAFVSSVELLLSKKYNIPINVNAMIEGEPLISFLINYENGIIHHLNPRSILYQIIKSRDDQRNESIIDLILQKRPNKKTIICALDLCKKVAKPNISKKLLAIKI